MCFPRALFFFNTFLAAPAEETCRSKVGKWMETATFVWSQLCQKLSTPYAHDRSREMGEGEDWW